MFSLQLCQPVSPRFVLNFWQDITELEIIKVESLLSQFESMTPGLTVQLYAMKSQKFYITLLSLNMLVILRSDQLSVFEPLLLVLFIVKILLAKMHICSISISALLKSIGFQADGRIDDRAYWINRAFSLSLPSTIALVFPRMVPIHELNPKVWTIWLGYI